MEMEHYAAYRKRIKSRLKLPEVPESLFVSDRFSHLIKYPIKKYKLPRHYNDKVELDPIPSLSPLITSLGPCTYRPFIIKIPDNDRSKKARERTTMFVIGTREIFDKREQIQKLRLLAGLSLSVDVKETSKKNFEFENDARNSRVCARGGAARSGEDDPEGGAGADPWSNAGKDAGKPSKKGSVTPGGASKEAAEDGASRLGSTASRGRTKRRRSRKMSDKTAKIKKNSASKEAVKEKPKTKKELVAEAKVAASKEQKEATIIIDIKVIERPEIEQIFLTEDVPEQDQHPDQVEITEEVKRKEDEQDEQFKDRDVIIPDDLGGAEERDNEWLNLSDSHETEAEERREAERLVKEKESWMLKGISYESQHLIHVKRLFIWSSKLTGRSPFYTKPNYRDLIIEFIVNRRKEFIYFSTTVILWFFYVLIIQGVFDVLMISVSSEYNDKEKQEFQKHLIPLLLVIGQLTVVAFWSILVLLNYGLRMTHYFNTWSMAVTEMEINAGKGVFKLTVGNHLWFAFYSFVLITCFSIDNPVNVRGAMQLLTVMLVRNFIPEILNTKSKTLVLVLQSFGLVLYLYIAFCTRIIYNQIYIYAKILQNSSEMWNLKFALKFEQIPTSNSGFLRLLKARQTLFKIWLHHRLLTGLCIQLGDVFAMPLMLSFVMQLGVVILCMVFLFNQAFNQTYAKQEDAYKKLVNENKLFDPIIVSRKPTNLEDTLTGIFVLLYFIIDFCINSYFITAASEAFRDGFEFVRRRGLILCKTSHERRLLQSLQWSYSAVNPSQINLLGFFSISRGTMLSFLNIALLLWSLIIQLQAEKLGVIVVYHPNCTVKPRGRFPINDSDFLCRKKVWLGENSINGEIERILLLDPDNDLVAFSEQTRRRRRRDTLGPAPAGNLNPKLDSKFKKLFQNGYVGGPPFKSGENYDKIPQKIKMPWLTTAAFTPKGYIGGNCLNNSITKDDLDYHDYYRAFHEPCFSPYLNITLVYPKLYREESRVWLGRKAVDCGIFPFPLGAFFPKDCSGDEGDPNLENLANYDDCGWKKSVVDERVFSNYRQRVHGTIGATIGKVAFKFKDGGTFECWNIFSELKRCKLLQEMKDGSAICRMARDSKLLNSKWPLLKPREYISKYTLGV